MAITCGAPNVKTRAGAQACQAVCDAARCCTDATADGCFAERRYKTTCMAYHQVCSILDGGVTADGATHELPADYGGGGWFETKDHDVMTNMRGKKVIPKDHLPHSSSSASLQIQREEACENHNTKYGLKECVRLCMPAGCCYTSAASGADFCEAPSGTQVDCRHYHDCNVLYHTTTTAASSSP